MYAPSSSFFVFNDTATTEIYTLSLHHALPLSSSAATRPTPEPSRASRAARRASTSPSSPSAPTTRTSTRTRAPRSEEHTSELQSRQYLVCRLLLEKKNTTPVSSCHCTNGDAYW